MHLQRLAPPPGSRLVVLGGCGGIGRALVKAALENELRVAVLDLPRSLDEHPPPMAVETWPVDARVEAELGRAFGALDARWGGLDHLVNLAGSTGGPHRVEQLELQELQSVHDAVLRTCFLSCRAAVPLIHRGGGGSIVNLTSGLVWSGRPGYAAYAAAKAAIVSLTRTLAVETAPEVRVNAVAPGTLATAWQPDAIAARQDPGLIELGDAVRHIPLGRVATPEDVVGPILFLTSEAASYVTGQVLHLNGGTLTP